MGDSNPLLSTPTLERDFSSSEVLFGPTVDGRNPAPPKKPWNDLIPLRSYQQTLWFHFHGFRSWCDFWISQPSTVWPSGFWATGFGKSRILETQIGWMADFWGEFATIHSMSAGSFIFLKLWIQIGTEASHPVHAWSFLVCDLSEVWLLVQTGKSTTTFG